MTKIIAVIGVTGVQGSSVAETFLEAPGWQVRGITRNPDGEVAKSLEAKGVEIFKGDLDDKQSLIPAFKGASAIFSNTDFFGHLFTALSSKDPSGRTPNQYAFDREVEQGVNIAEAAASPEVTATLEHFVLSSLADVKKWSHGKYTGVYHNDSKAEIIRVIETKLPAVAKCLSTVVVGHYVTMWKAFPAMSPQKQPDGSFLIKRPVNPDQKFPFVVTHKDTGSFVKALVDLPPQKHIFGVSEEMTWPDWTKLWGEVLGVQARYQQVSNEEFFKAAPGPLGQELGETYDFIAEFGYTGGDPEVMTAQQLDFEIPLTSMKEYIKSEDWSTIL